MCTKIILVGGVILSLVSCKGKVVETQEVRDPSTGETITIPTQEGMAAHVRERRPGMKPWEIVFNMDILMEDKNYKAAVERYILPSQQSGISGRQASVYASQLYPEAQAGGTETSLPVSDMIEQFFLNNVGRPAERPYKFGMVADNFDDIQEKGGGTYAIRVDYHLCDIKSELKVIREEYNLHRDITRSRRHLQEFYNLVGAAISTVRPCDYGRSGDRSGAMYFQKLNGEYYIDYYKSDVFRSLDPYAAYAASIIMSKRTPVCWEKNITCPYEVNQK